MEIKASMLMFIDIRCKDRMGTGQVRLVRAGVRRFTLHESTKTHELIGEIKADVF